MPRSVGLAGIAIALLCAAPAADAAPVRGLLAPAVTGLPFAAAPGDRLRPALAIRNPTRRSVRRVRLVLLLSHDRRRGRSDVRLHGRLRLALVRKRSRVTRRGVFTVPDGAPAGSWRVLVCVRRGRCSAARRRLQVVPRVVPTAPAAPAAGPQAASGPDAAASEPPPIPPAGACSGGGDPTAPDIGVTPGPAGARQPVLAGRILRSEVVLGEPAPVLVQKPEEPHYPGGAYPAGPPAWTQPLPASDTLIYAADADARFNDEDAAHRVAFHLSHYGGQPDRAGDLNGDGVDDLIVTEHFAYVDGMQYAGEVHVYYGRPGARIDPTRHVPDIVFYGDEDGAKLGLSVTAAGDMNGDGWDDVAMSAGFHSERREDGTLLPHAGEIYVVYGGFLQAFGCTVKVRAGDIGTKVPGLVLAGGHDGRRYTGWANDLEAGDFNGDGFDDLLIGAADPYRGDAPTFAARGYLLYGGTSLPARRRGYRLGVDRDVDGMRTDVFEAPDGEVTRQSLGFGASFVGDLNGDGRDEIAFALGLGGPDERGTGHVFLGRPAPFGNAVVPIGDADLVIAADDMASPPLRFARLEGLRPAGDVDGDGIEDLLVGMRSTQRLIGGQWTRVGAVGVLLGRPALPADVAASELDSILLGAAGGQIGQPAVDQGADLDGDDRADILVNDPYHRESIGGDVQLRGRLWMVKGGPALAPVVEVPQDAHRTFLADTRVPGMFGYTWNTGDFDGDGRTDVLVGDHYAGDHELHEHAGRVYLFYNGSSFVP